jgi:hypothetical protein
MNRIPNNQALKDKSYETLAFDDAYVETRDDYLLKGRNGLESAVIISDQLGNMWGGPKLMEWERFKAILRTLNENEIRYAIIGGIAMGQHALPRTTRDLDILVAMEDLQKVRALFEKYYQSGTQVVQVYDIEGTRLVVLPANLRFRVAALDARIDSNLEEVNTKVVCVRDLLTLKLFAIADRTDPVKALQDKADAAALLKYGAETITKDDINYIAKTVLGMGYTKEEAEKFHNVILWLNETLELLKMEEMTYPFEK